MQLNDIILLYNVAYRVIKTSCFTVGLIGYRFKFNGSLQNNVTKYFLLKYYHFAIHFSYIYSDSSKCVLSM